MRHPRILLAVIFLLGLLVMRQKGLLFASQTAAIKPAESEQAPLKLRRVRPLEPSSKIRRDFTKI